MIHILIKSRYLGVDEMNKLNEKYDLTTAICVVSGIVVGTGIFFKTGVILKETNGSFWLGILAWVIGGAVMLFCSFNFATISLKHHNITSLNDFANVTVGNKYAAYIGSFVKNIYFPSMTATVAFVAGMYTCELFNIKGVNYPFTLPVFLFAGGYLIVLFILNIIAPIIAGKFQVSTTIIKLIPLLLMAIVGTIYGLTSNTLIDNVNSGSNPDYGGNGIFAAICVTAFSYEGWICATNIGEEIKHKHKNLPKALLIGSLIVIVIYILYNIGISGALSHEEIIAGGSSSTSIKIAFTNLFGNFSATLLNIVIVISALGTLNGLIMANSRAGYTLAKYNLGICPKKFTYVSKKHSIPTVSAIYAFFITIFWLIYYYFSQTNKLANGIGFPFSSDELPIITTYLFYIPIFIAIYKNTDLSFFKRIVLPTLGIISAILMITASIYRHGINTLWYLIFFILFMALTTFVFILNKRQKLDLS